MKKEVLNKIDNFKDFEIQKSEKIRGGESGSRLTLMATCTPEWNNPNDPDLTDLKPTEG